jgi:hypothetical protein
MQMWLVRKWLYLAFGVLITFVVCVHYVDRMLRCKADGLSRDEALVIANWKLGIQIKDSDLLRRFKILSDQFESGKVWSITYQAEDCLIIINVDKCGVTDIGGLSRGCPRQWSEPAAIDPRMSNRVN